MSAHPTYSLSVGQADAKRLHLLNCLYNPYTERFRNAYLPDLRGKTVLDIGCGTGILSCYWAKEVGPTGKVIGVDISAEQLAVAKDNAQAQQLHNIEWINLDIRELQQLNTTVDLVYCRFVLIHLFQQEALLQKLYDRLAPGGYLFCEEAMGYEAFFADPPSPAFNAWRQLLLNQPQLHGTDFALGKRLHSLFSQLPLHAIQGEIVQPIVAQEKLKPLFYLGLTPTVRQKFIDKGFATAPEIEQIVQNLRAEMDGKPWAAGFVKTMQICGQKQAL